MASTETGIIFGNIVYDVSGVSGDRSCVVLNDIHIDIMDYIFPASCTDTGLQYGHLNILKCKLNASEE